MTDPLSVSKIPIFDHRDHRRLGHHRDRRRLCWQEDVRDWKSRDRRQHSTSRCGCMHWDGQRRCAVLRAPQTLARDAVRPVAPKGWLALALEVWEKA